MAKKENFQEYVARTQNEIAGIESKIEAEELKELQLEHKICADCRGKRKAIQTG